MCGEGVRTRERTCNNTLTGITCTIDGSNATETRKCQQDKCTTPAPTTGTGNHSNRSLMTLFLSHSLIYTFICKIYDLMSAPQVIDCRWGMFPAWSLCSRTCGGGFETRERVKDREAANGGKECTGLSMEFRSCNSMACPSKTLLYLKI